MFVSILPVLQCLRGDDFHFCTLSGKTCQSITLSVHLICLQHVRRDAARRAGLQVTADPCSFVMQS